ncbi:hypothetical protein [Mycolicibacterium vinylchloridicum]|uniref:hypothetical protein n=1 Tax=Mycolicibacterium vinylchloridicum TaxID=2736928 RepID=UPI0015CEDB56|nr:hypothetical protein [Mycolicibacterium vinylchloridicum]
MIMKQSLYERQHLTAAMSLGDIIAGAVADYRPLAVHDVLSASAESLTVPTGWLIASAGVNVAQPVRVLVTGHRSRGGWQGCDTLAAFGFTGIVPRELGTANASCTLNALGASGITIRNLTVSEQPEAWAVRSTGYVTAVGLRMWAQFSTYVAGSQEAGCGRLIEHSVFTVTQRRAQLRSDIRELSHSVAVAFSQLNRGFQPGQVGPSG